MWSACPTTRRGDHPRHTLQDLQLVLAHLLLIVIDLHRALIASYVEALLFCWRFDLDVWSCCR